jgi:hypothetical protein
MLKQIMDQCGGLDIFEKRRVSDAYSEIVFCNKDNDKWNKLFEDIFGFPAKSAGVKPTEEHLSLTKDYGGIHANQTLFKKIFDDSLVIAMLWPWQDDTHTTLKMFHVIINK